MPILDPKPTGKPHDWSYGKIISAKAITPEYPPSYKNHLVTLTAPRDQADRGTCVGQSTATCYDLKYMMLKGDLPSAEDKAQFTKDVTDEIGTVHDILYPQSASAEMFYQMSRFIGNVDYPSGSEIRFSSRSWIKYGMNLENQWHTDKKGTCVWTYPPGVRVQANGGFTQAQAEEFGKLHCAEGYAQVGTPGGNCTWDEVCYAIYKNGFVLGAIPVYENYLSMQGGTGEFPEPRGELAGFHALCFYGYDSDNLYLIHSWGDWCGRYGSISKQYFNHAIDLIQFFVVLDSADTLIGQTVYSSLAITANVPAQITVDGSVIGITPLKIATEPGKVYTITASAEGYESQTKQVVDVTGVDFILVPIQKTWWQKLIDIIMGWFGR